jgi:hypothetical protein
MARPTPEQLGVRAKAQYDAVSALLCSWGLPGWLASWLAAWPAEIMLVGESVVTAGLAAYVHTFGFLFEEILGAVDEARQELDPEVAKLSVGVLNELFGGTISPDDIAQGVSPASARQRAQSVGNKFRTALLDEFIPGGSITPRSGYDAAAAFAGYAVNFATATAFVAILADALSFGHFEQFRELGVAATRNLGLGRMQARSWRAIIDEVINVPAQRYVRNQYRTTIPGEAQLVQLYDAALINDTQLYQWMGYLGWPNDLIQAVVEFHRKRMPDATIERLLRYKLLTLDQAVGYLRIQGYPLEIAQLILADFDLARADRWQQQILSFALEEYVKGFIDVEAFTSVTTAANLGDGERTILNGLADFRRNLPREQLTEAQGVTALVENAIDLTEFATLLRNHGYSDNDALTLQVLALIKQGNKAEAIRVAQYKWEQAAAKATAKGLPAPPKPPILTNP